MMPRLRTASLLPHALQRAILTIAIVEIEHPSLENRTLNVPPPGRQAAKR
jgi:hypothetical protein